METRATVLAWLGLLFTVDSYPTFAENKSIVDLVKSVSRGSARPLEPKPATQRPPVPGMGKARADELAPDDRRVFDLLRKANSLEESERWRAREALETVGLETLAEVRARTENSSHPDISAKRSLLELEIARRERANTLRGGNHYPNRMKRPHPDDYSRHSPIPLSR